LNFETCLKSKYTHKIQKRVVELAEGGWRY